MGAFRKSRNDPLAEMLQAHAARAARSAPTGLVTRTARAIEGVEQPPQGGVVLQRASHVRLVLGACVIVIAGSIVTGLILRSDSGRTHQAAAPTQDGAAPLMAWSRSKQWLNDARDATSERLTEPLRKEWSSVRSLGERWFDAAMSRVPPVFRSTAESTQPRDA